MTKWNFHKVGTKAASLRELINNGFNIPRGFYITCDSQFYIIEHINLKPKIDTIVSSFNCGDFGSLGEKTTEILAATGSMPVLGHFSILSGI